MKKYIFLNIIFFMGVVFYVLSLSTISFADQVQDSDEKISVIDQEMDCVASGLKSNHQITWTDVCVTKPNEYRTWVKRDQIINSELDRFEGKSSAVSQPRKVYQRESRIDNYYQSSTPQNNYRNELKTLEVEPYVPEKPTYKTAREPITATFGEYKTKLDIQTGRRLDNFNWNIAGNIDGTNPNILSELIWEDLKIWQIKSKGQIIIDDEYVIDGMLGYGRIYDGENQDSDYSGDNRTSEFSRSNNSADDGSVFDISGALGYRIAMGPNQENKKLNRILAFDKIKNIDEMWLTLLLGYSYHKQNLSITDGVQTVNTISSFLGPFSGLDSSYDAQWDGPWLGVEITGVLDKLSGLFRFEYHNVDYYAQADWNLRTDFNHPKSFEHEGEGRGLVFNFGVDYQVNNDWTIGVDADIQDWRIENGLDRVFFTDGSKGETKLNEVNWESYAIMFGATFVFE